jgi:hypothetical protein
MNPVQTNTLCKGWNGSQIGFETDKDQVKQGDSLNPPPEPFLLRNESQITERGLNACVSRGS